MQNYQLTVLVKDSLDEKTRMVLLDSIKKQFDAVNKEDLWGNRSLAYPIQHQTKAFYVHYEFSADQSKISNLDKMIKLNEDVLRHLLIVRQEKKARKTSRIKSQTSGDEKVEVKKVEEKEVAEESITDEVEEKK